jgi:hypothetical protein
MGWLARDRINSDRSQSRTDAPFLSFDRYVESITWALDDGDLDKESYSFDSYCFPGSTDQKEEADPEKRGSAQREREKRSEMPGILLFRRSPNARTWTARIRRRIC